MLSLLSLGLERVVDEDHAVRESEPLGRVRARVRRVVRRGRVLIERQRHTLVAQAFDVSILTEQVRDLTAKIPRDTGALTERSLKLYAGSDFVLLTDTVCNV